MYLFVFRISNFVGVSSRTASSDDTAPFNLRPLHNTTVIVSLLRRDPSNSILSDKIIQNLTFLVTTISDLTLNLFAFFVMEIAFLLTHQVQSDISLRFSDGFEILTYGQRRDCQSSWHCDIRFKIQNLLSNERKNNSKCYVYIKERNRTKCHVALSES